MPSAVAVAAVQMIEDNQGPGGDVPVVIPAGNPADTSCNDIAWTSAYPQISSMLHTHVNTSRKTKRTGATLS